MEYNRWYFLGAAVRCVAHCYVILHLCCHRYAGEYPVQLLPIISFFINYILKFFY